MTTERCISGSNSETTKLAARVADVFFVLFAVATECGECVQVYGKPMTKYLARRTDIITIQSQSIIIIKKIYGWPRQFQIKRITMGSASNCQAYSTPVALNQWSFISVPSSSINISRNPASCPKTLLYKVSRRLGYRGRTNY